jgi:hypothetical protein
VRPAPAAAHHEVRLAEPFLMSRRSGLEPCPWRSEPTTLTPDGGSTAPGTPVGCGDHLLGQDLRLVARGCGLRARAASRVRTLSRPWGSRPRRASWRPRLSHCCWAGHSSQRFGVIQALLLGGIALDALRDPGGAPRVLERALNLAETSGVLLPFLFFPAADLLERHARVRAAHASLISDIHDLLSGRTPPAPGEAQPLLEPISESELRVLRYARTMTGRHAGLLAASPSDHSPARPSA